MKTLDSQWRADYPAKGMTFYSATFGVDPGDTPKTFETHFKQWYAECGHPCHYKITVSALGQEFSAVINNAFEYDCFMTGVQIGWELIPEKAP